MPSSKILMTTRTMQIGSPGDRSFATGRLISCLCSIIFIVFWFGLTISVSSAQESLRVVIKGPDGKPHQQVDEVRSGGGYFAQNDMRIHFGLGEATSVDLLEVRWPNGETQSFKDLAVNKLYLIKEGESAPQAQELKPAKSK